MGMPNWYTFRYSYIDQEFSLIVHQVVACWIQCLVFVRRTTLPTSTMPLLASVNALCMVGAGGMRTGSPADWNA